MNKLIALSFIATCAIVNNLAFAQAIYDANGQWTDLIFSTTPEERIFDNLSP